MMQSKTLTIVTADKTEQIDLKFNRETSDEMQAAWAMASELRGSLNALNLCVRVLEGDLPDSEAREYIKHIGSATQRIERLLARRQMARSA